MTSKSRQSNSEFRGALGRTGVVVIIRSDFTVSHYSKVAAELFEAGLDTLEITVDQPEAFDALRELIANGPRGLYLGAGTVRSADDAHRALEAGARFLVSPGFVKEVGRVAEDAGIAYLPGVLTPSEVETAAAAGWRTLKLFPALPMGPTYLKALTGPFADIAFVPSGGVDAGNARQFIDAGALAVGVGGSLLSKVHDPATLRETAARLLENVRGSSPYG